MINRALIFAARAHDGQVRKGTDIPYITHPFAVGMSLQQSKCSEEVITAGILHDTLEDTDVTYEQLVNEFGENVAKLVKAASEHDKSLPWKERKLHTIQALPNHSLEEIYVIIADKLHNLSSIREDLEKDGEAVWSRFNRGKKEQHWYYSNIVKSLLPRKKECKLIGRLEKEVKAVFGSVEWMSKKEIDILFSCCYGIYDKERNQLEKYDLLSIAEEISNEGDYLYRSGNQKVLIEKLRDFANRGIEFEINSDGPLILAGFCIAVQKHMNWSDDEVFKHFKRNLKKM